ncbi:MAG: CocE/NonD family hydrolase [Isosphaeraceae bacterium]
MRRSVVTTLALLPLLAFDPSTAAAQGLEEVKARYTKYEYRIPMRDGVKLFTAVYVPKDAAPGGPLYPIIFTRTPYSVAPYGVDKYKSDLGPSPLFGKDGYICVYQDVRGRWMSEGEFVNMRPEKDGSSRVDESTDTYDTIDWLVKNVPGNNGRVGQYGISYPGFYTACGVIDAHPALKAASPQAPVIDWFIGDDWHHNGAFQLTHCFNFMAVFGHPRPEPTTKPNAPRPFEYGTPDGYDYHLRLGPLANVDQKIFKGDVAFWNEVMTHGNYDSWWQARNLRPHLKDVKPAVMTVGGWFDAENLFGALECYKAIEKSTPGATNVLVMGPWLHGGWSRNDGSSLGHVSFNSKTAAFYREQIEKPFFDYYLKGTGSPAGGLPEAYAFETGRNQWRKFEAWPPKGSKPTPVYLREKGALGFDAPADAGDAAADEYPSDPAHPVPFIDQTVNAMITSYMVDDQRFASRRPDVLTYQSPVLDKDMTVAGPIKVTLHVSTTGTDSDWVVKVIDVYPDDASDPEPNPTNVKIGGFQQLLRGDVFRGKFRKSFESPEPFTPGEPAEITFNLQDVCHTFRPGHRIMVQVQSSWFPLFDRNPQKFVDIYSARESDFQKATQKVYRSKARASRLELPVLP